MTRSDPLRLLEHYLSNADEYWREGLGWRQADKLNTFLEQAASAGRVAVKDAIDMLVTRARARSANRPPPVYVVNIGGSGSHWLGNMLNEIPGLVDAAEVYLPPPLEADIRPLPQKHQSMIVDGIHLAHAWGRSGDWERTSVASIVNTAHRPQLIDVFRNWDPDCSVIHLFRDPRDRALSVAYRKAKYRNESAPGMDDEEYLRRKAKRSDTYLRRYLKAPHQADVELRYEDLKSNPRIVLKGLCETIAPNASDADIDRAVYLHDASNIRAGKVASKGNLDEGGQSRGWSSASARDRQVMHHILAFPVSVLRYANDDCLARDEIPVHQCRRRRLATIDVPADLDISTKGSAFSRLDRRSIPRDATFRMRPQEPFEQASLEAMVNVLQPDVLCLAGLKGFTDHSLEFLRQAPHIRGIDISGTQVTNRSRSILDSMPNLEWVAAIDTQLEGLEGDSKVSAFPWSGNAQ